MVNHDIKRAIKWSQVEEQYHLGPMMGMAAEYDFNKAWREFAIAFNVLALGEAKFDKKMTNRPVVAAARVEQLKDCWCTAVLKGLGIYESEDPEDQKTARIVKAGINSLEAFSGGRAKRVAELAIAGGLKEDPDFISALPPHKPRRKYELKFY